MLGPSAWIGFAIVSAIMFDFLSTTVSLRSGGFVAKHVGSAVRGLSSALPMTRRSFSGPIALAAVALTWVVGLWIGWAFVFADALDGFAGPEGSVLTMWDALGFSGSTLSTLGLGVLTPKFAWIHVLTVVSAVSGMIVLTLSVTYVLNVSQIATSSRAIARWLDDLYAMAKELDPSDAARLLLQSDTSLRQSLRLLTEQRTSFPLAGIYEWRGSDRDVIRAAVELQASVRRIRAEASDPVSAVRFATLDAALGELSRS